MTDDAIVRQYLDWHFRICTWPADGDRKGPTEVGWPAKHYTFDDYHDGDRVGLLTGVELAPGRYYVDVDLDDVRAADVAQHMLLPTAFIYGRASKPVSHCGYTLPHPIPSRRYEDLDKTCLLEVRCTKTNGDIGLQNMAPPSVWSKNGLQEPLAFRTFGLPQHYEDPQNFEMHHAIVACSMLLGVHLGRHQFGHAMRLAWAGYFLRAGVLPEMVIRMGEALSVHCHNTEVSDVRRVVESTVDALQNPKKKVPGGRAFAKLIGEEGRALIQRMNTWLGRDADFVRTDKGLVVAKSQTNIARAIELLGHELSYDQFTDKALLDHQPMEDREVNALLLTIDREFQFLPPDDFYQKVIVDLAWTNRYHPVQQYLDPLQWDGVPRLDTWLMQAAGAEDSAYVRAVSSILLIAAVHRVRAPGCKYDEMVVWESAQGGLKSTAARELCPNPAWFTDDLPLNIDSKVMIEKTLGKWIVEASDLAGKRKTEIEHLKATLSRQVDGPARMAYAHFPVERPRQFILIGTTNSSVYLTDPTGARRFWPVPVGVFNIAWIVQHRDQLWAEACAREQHGESIRLKEELWPDATAHQEQRREIDPWERILRSELLLTPPLGDGRIRVPTDRLWEWLAIPMDRRDRMGALRISEIMQRLGFVRTRVRPSGQELQVGYRQEDLQALTLGEGGESLPAVESENPGM